MSVRDLMQRVIPRDKAHTLRYILLSDNNRPVDSALFQRVAVMTFAKVNFLRDNLSFISVHCKSAGCGCIRANYFTKY